ncbi:PaaI family thioesterase [Methanofollis fontis]|uniref:Phenylacetic acid degradation protein n=1 Tax=Methanofollis fontis TaxID=2052832 RepID=A0A483CU62_9EURY|nr:PaaI family thioesterase [Methanofollis fontis]TAJ44304.1 phenylacetic acid degradation protein [Methanofollis fontis]
MAPSDIEEKGREFFAADLFARENGLELVAVSSGRATVSMQVADRHRNSHGTVHGGALFTLADVAFALASNSHGIDAAAINAHITYMTAAKDGVLTAEAEEFGLNPKLASYTVTITDEEGRKIAIFQGMVYRRTPRPSPEYQ